MRRNRKSWVIIGAIALLFGGGILWLTWPGDDNASRACAKVPAGSVAQAPELSCAGFSKRPPNEAFGWLADAQQPQAEIWGDDKGRKVAVSDFNDGADENSQWATRYVGVWVPDPNVWCTPEGRAMGLEELLATAGAVQRTVADGSATIGEDGEVTSETKLWCFVERQLD